MSVDQALFQPFPSEVFFQQFESHQVYEFPLKFRNLDVVAHNIRVTSEDSPYFSTTCRQAVGSKVAPSMEVAYSVTFTPDEKKVHVLEQLGIGIRVTLSILICRIMIMS